MLTVTDAQLLRYEPRLFDRAQAMADIVATWSLGEVSSSILMSGPVSFDELGITSGHVVDVKTTIYEVLERLSATQLLIAFPKMTPDSPARQANDIAGAEVKIISFQRYVAQASAWVSRRLDLAGDDSSSSRPSAVGTADLTQLTMIRSAVQILQGAAALAPDDATLAALLSNQQRELSRALHQTVVTTDRDGDTVPDGTRRPDAITLRRI